MTVKVFDERRCDLGEGPLWHPERNQLFWFDISGKKLLTVEDGNQRSWQFAEHVSAAGWVDRDTLLIASETGLFKFDIPSGKSEMVTPLEADDRITRSNDGRADPWGGFWIGTMGKGLETRAGAIYRWYKGELTLLFGNITISNSICFSPDHKIAYFTDTVTSKISRQALDSNGWPKGEAKIFVDLSEEGLRPDGSVVDSEGCLWNAQWGASRVARYSTNGSFLSAVDFPAVQISCPAFGGENLTTLFATSANEGMGEACLNDGRTFSWDGGFLGQLEHKVIL